MRSFGTYFALIAGMNLSRTLSVLLCALVAPVTLSMTGCEKEVDPLTREEFCEKWASAACTSEVVAVCQKSEAKCQAAQAASCRDWLPNTFQDVGVDECLAAVTEAYSDADLKAADLEVVWQLDGACRDIVTAGESGESCQLNTDCSGSSGLTCVLKDRANGTCQRAEVVGAGLSCSEPEQMCESGFYCNGDNCIVALEVEEDCKNDKQCAEGLYCRDEQCEPQFAMGADCSSDRECESGICYEIDEEERVCVDRIRLSPAEPACDGLK